MKILGISAHYHDSAAALRGRRRAGLRRAGGAAVAAQERRRPSRWRPSSGASSSRPRAGGARRGGLLRAADAEVRSHPDHGAAGLPAVLASLPEGDEELARREGLGARHHLVAPRRAGTQDPVHRAPPDARRRRVPDRADATRGDPDRPTASASGRRSRSATASGAPNGTTAITLLREMRFPHSLGMLYSTFTAYLGFAVNEGEYKVMGLAGVRATDVADEVRQGDSAHARRRLRARPRLLRVPHDGRALLFVAVRRAVRAAAHAVRPDRPVDTADGRRFADIAASVQRVLEEILVDMARDAPRARPACPTCASAAAWR